MLHLKHWAITARFTHWPLNHFLFISCVCNHNAYATAAPLSSHLAASSISFNVFTKSERLLKRWRSSSSPRNRWKKKNDTQTAEQLTINQPNVITAKHCLGFAWFGGLTAGCQWKLQSICQMLHVLLNSFRSCHRFWSLRQPQNVSSFLVTFSAATARFKGHSC